ncbi:MAG: NADPH:quinone oxidoreductase family protein [Nitratireductor sp.]|nr:NADPH:quinone oxidoreductase family protein [Nitratireductor sp.]
MKAILCRAYGSIDDLSYAEVADPVAAADGVVIRAEAIGANFPDGLLVQGLYQLKPGLPFIPGMEVVGTVEAAGEKVSHVRPGDRVAGLVAIGGYAEKVAVAASSTMPVPDGADAGEVTALICGYGTAHYALKQRAGLKPGETLAVTGAAGLTGLAAIQIGKAMGARVIAIASSAEKRRLCLENGADEALGYDDLKDTLKAATGGKGADVIFDVAGGAVFDACSRAVAWNGRLLVIGFASGTIPKFPVNLALVKGYSVVGVFWGDFTRREPAVFADNMRELFGWYASGTVKPVVEKTYPLERAADALNHIHGRKATGKIVLKP